MKQLDILAAILLVVGGLNWGLVAVANFDLVAALTGAGAFGAKHTLGVIVDGPVDSGAGLDGTSASLAGTGPDLVLR